MFRLMPLTCTWDDIHIYVIWAHHSYRYTIAAVPRVIKHPHGPAAAPAIAPIIMGRGVPSFPLEMELFVPASQPVASRLVFHI